MNDKLLEQISGIYKEINPRDLQRGWIEVPAGTKEPKTTADNIFHKMDNLIAENLVGIAQVGDYVFNIGENIYGLYRTAMINQPFRQVSCDFQYFKGIKVQLIEQKRGENTRYVLLLEKNN